jgi:hypothetical protein
VTWCPDEAIAARAGHVVRPRLGFAGSRCVRSARLLQAQPDLQCGTGDLGGRLRIWTVHEIVRPCLFWPLRRAEGPVCRPRRRNGVAAPGAKREGDGRTPYGAYPMRGGFGIYANPGLSSSWLVTSSHDVWVDDSRSSLYNTHQRTPVNGRWVSAEAMRISPAYNYAQVIGYNERRTPGRGSAIFLHVDQGRGDSRLRVAADVVLAGPHALAEGRCLDLDHAVVQQCRTACSGRRVRRRGEVGGSGRYCAVVRRTVPRSVCRKQLSGLTVEEEGQNPGFQGAVARNSGSLALKVERGDRLLRQIGITDTRS